MLSKIGLSHEFTTTCISSRLPGGGKSFIPKLGVYPLVWNKAPSFFRIEDVPGLEVCDIALTPIGKDMRRLVSGGSGFNTARCTLKEL
ncbi:hypothetical protein PoB_006634800 [Plakobranchus ocellatus]|uniref:Uncharacterized protein n=1 Tax=Plakobranchus ocellatus TaxID=259542 RepID=A0AAV4D6Q2_9GAST|nr:hypothetical protein PoB_006634800 [Plakobranchus ocellatus]